MNEDDVSRLVGDIYEASEDDTIWPGIAERLSQLFGDAPINIDSNMPERGPGTFAVFTLYDSSLRDLHYEEYYTPDANPGIAALMRTPIGEPFDLASFVDRHTYEYDPSIRAILHPQRINKGLFVTLERTNAAFGMLCVFRHTYQDDFEANHSKALRYLSGHITRSIQWRRSRFSQQREKYVAAFKTVNSRKLEGILTLSLRGVVVEADAGAQQILELQEGLALRRGYLVSTSRRSGQSNENLMKFIKTDRPDISNFSISSHEASVTTIERIPIVLGAGANPSARYIVLKLRRIPRLASLDVSSFAKSFELTPAETRVVEALIRSANASDAAKEIGIARDTIKSHLNSIYAKSGTVSLPQLMLAIGQSN